MELEHEYENFAVEEPDNESVYEEVNIDENEDARDYIISEGHRTMPQFYTDTGELFVEGGFQGLKDHLDKENIDTTQLGTI